MLLISLFGTAVGSLLTGVAGSIAILFLGRIVDGASGASVSVAQAAVADVAPAAGPGPAHGPAGCCVRRGVRGRAGHRGAGRAR